MPPPAAEWSRRAGERTGLLDGPPHGVVEIRVPRDLLHAEVGYLSVLLYGDSHLDREFPRVLLRQLRDGPVRPDLFIERPGVGQYLGRNAHGPGRARQPPCRGGR